MLEPPWGKIWQLLMILNVHGPSDPAIPSDLTQEICGHVFLICEQSSCTVIFLSALFIIVQNGKKSRFLPIAEQLHSDIL